MTRFEHFSQPILPYAQWLHRVFSAIRIAVLVVGSSLIIGIVGYHVFAGLSWIDSILESSMILAGMGPISPMTTDGAKLFASAYALMSGLVILSSTGILLAPWVHRLLHTFHGERRRHARPHQPDPQEPHSTDNPNGTKIS